MNDGQQQISTNSALGLADALVWASAFGTASAEHDARAEERRIVVPGSTFGYPAATTAPDVLAKLHRIAARAVLRARGQAGEPTDAQVAALHAFMIQVNVGGFS